MNGREATEPPAVLLMGYGSPGGPDELADYLADVLHRPPSPAMVEEYRRRYGLIGGSPQRRIIESLRAKLERRLAQAGSPGSVYLGVKHWKPNVSEIVPQIVRDGFRRIVAIPLAPYASTWILEPYRATLEAGRAASSAPVEVDLRSGWHLDPALVGYWAKAIRAALAGAGDPPPFPFLSAHSLPGRYADRGDPYPQLLRATAEAIAREGGLADWEFTFQSAGNTTEPWLGPDVTERIAARKAEGSGSVLIAPFGFVFDHLEVLYDLDVVVRGFAEKAGMRYLRAPLPNDADDLVEALAHVVARDDPPR